MFIPDAMRNYFADNDWFRRSARVVFGVEQDRDRLAHGACAGGHE